MQYPCPSPTKMMICLEMFRIQIRDGAGEQEDGVEQEHGTKKEDIVEWIGQRLMVTLKNAQPISAKVVDEKGSWIPVCAAALDVRGFAE